MNAESAIVIPCLDEAATIAGVLRDIERAFSPGPLPSIVVVDDGSTDGTGDVARRQEGIPVLVVRHDHPRGYGEAIKTGILNAHADMICLMDGDGQHAASDARRLLEQCRPRTLVVGRRNDPGAGSRRVARSLLRRWSRAIGGTDVQDSNSGMMAFPRALAVRMLPFLPEGMAYSDSFKLLFSLLRMAVTEVPIDVGARRAGRSKNRVMDGVRTVFSTLVMVVLINPTRVFLPVGIGMLGFGVAWGIPFLVMGRGLTAVSLTMILAGIMCLFFGLIFRILAGITQSIIVGPDR
ncbi:MAG: glycosyltransferase family 2 protein [Gemmatimonadetes bacterium]|nr:glycosyltransferase family 2 protein [Gemmatimonadota bacterium]